MKKVIHVNQNKIKSNHKSGNREPVLTVKGYGKKKNGDFYKTHRSNDYCHEAYVSGPCKIIYSPDNPLSCGARVWIETESEVICLVKEQK